MQKGPSNSPEEGMIPAHHLCSQPLPTRHPHPQHPRQITAALAQQHPAAALGEWGLFSCRALGGKGHRFVPDLARSHTSCVPGALQASRALAPSGIPNLPLVPAWHSRFEAAANTPCGLSEEYQPGAGRACLCPQPLGSTQIGAAGGGKKFRPSS